MTLKRYGQHTIQQTEPVLKQLDKERTATLAIRDMEMREHDESPGDHR
jgi:hypothetical protein